MDDQSTMSLQQEEVDSTKKCLNCGTVLNGEYCHNCGQHVTDHTMNVKRFILNYLDNAFLWDPQHLKTIWRLISRPGVLTKDYLAGKFVSQVQPLKLNMFLLFIFLTLFVFFASDKRVTSSIDSLSNNEMLYAILYMDEIAADEEYLQEVNASPRDTIDFRAPLIIAELYPNIVSVDQITYNSGGESLDEWTAIIPRILIEDGIIQLGEDGIYKFNTEFGVVVEDVAIAQAVVAKMLELTQQYLPVILLLTAPFLAFSLRVVLYKKKRNYFTHFIFSMHYIAFVDLTIIVIYLLHLLVDPSFVLLNIIFAVSSCVYFAIAFRVVYETSWFRSITKALLSNLIYYAICFILFAILFFIACYVVANSEF